MPFLRHFRDVFVRSRPVFLVFLWCFRGVSWRFCGVFVALSRVFELFFCVFGQKSGALVEGLLQGAQSTSFVAKSCWKRPFLEGLLQLKGHRPWFSGPL